MRRLAGAGVVAGLAVGRAVLLTRRGRALRAPVSADRVADEIARLERARERSRAQLEAIRQGLSEGPGADLAPLFDAQIMMLDDPLLLGRALALVQEERVNAEWAVQQAFDEVAPLFDAIGDPYLRERRGDVADVAGRLRMNLREGMRGWQRVLAQGDGPFVIVADDPPPSLAAQIDWTRVAGLAMDAGSRTSHTAILARSLGLPTVVGLGDATRCTSPGDLVLLDGATGELLISPDPDIVAERGRDEARRRSEAAPVRPESGPASTRDGVRITLEANVDRLEDAMPTLAADAEGIGLFRSEFVLMGGVLTSLVGPESEAVQTALYARLVEAAAPHPVTIRTFDLDEGQADACSGEIDPSHEAARHRPLGLRGIRLGLARPAMLETQLRAIARAAATGPVRVLLPFVTTREEVRAARTMLEAVRESLLHEGLHVPALPLGVMIEVPAAALTADALADEADFLAVGTNDLTQYTLAADRTDERVANVGDPFHPALLRVLRLVTRVAAKRRIPLSVCGEMASDPVLLALLIGLGVTSVSMTPAALAGARRLVKAADRRELVRLARRAVRLGQLGEIEEYVKQALGDLAPSASATVARG